MYPFPGHQHQLRAIHDCRLSARSLILLAFLSIIYIYTIFNARARASVCIFSSNCLIAWELVFVPVCQSHVYNRHSHSLSFYRHLNWINKADSDPLLWNLKKMNLPNNSKAHKTWKHWELIHLSHAQSTDLLKLLKFQSNEEKHTNGGELGKNKNKKALVCPQRQSTHNWKSRRKNADLFCVERFQAWVDLTSVRNSQLNNLLALTTAMMWRRQVQNTYVIWNTMNAFCYWRCCYTAAGPAIVLNAYHNVVFNRSNRFVCIGLAHR